MITARGFITLVRIPGNLCNTRRFTVYVFFNVMFLYFLELLVP